MTVNALSSYGSFTGLAKESSYGTAVTATVFTPATTIAFEDVKNYVSDTAMRGSAVSSYNEIPTQGWGTASYEMPVYMDTVGYPLAGLFGDIATTGSGPYVHVMSTKNSGTYQPASYTLVDFDVYEARKYAGSVFSQAAFTLSADGLLTAAIQATSLGSATVSTPSKSFSDDVATPGYTGVITLGGTPSVLVESATLTIARTVTPIIAVNATTSPTQVWAGPISVTGSMTCLFTDNTFLTPMLDGTPTELEVSYTNGDDILDIHMEDALFTKAPVTRNANGYMEITVDFTAVANTDDQGATGGYSPALVTLTNTVAAY